MLLHDHLLHHLHFFLGGGGVVRELEGEDMSKLGNTNRRRNNWREEGGKRRKEKSGESNKKKRKSQKKININKNNKFYSRFLHLQTFLAYMSSAWF